MKKETFYPPMKQEETMTAHGLQRRNLLKVIGASAAFFAIGGAAASCSKSSDPTPSSGVDLGSGDVGILNYAYALEQLEAAFYLQVVATPYSGISALELE